jgi:hypothetical protein
MRIIHRLAIVSTLTLISALPSTTRASDPKPQPRNFAVFVSPALTKPQKEQVLIEFERFAAGGGSQKASAQKGMIPGDTIRLYDASTLDNIGTELAIPPSARTPALQLGAANDLVGKFRDFLKKPDATNAVVNLPRLVESFREKVPNPNTEVLLIGTPLYHDDVDAHDMRRGWPSDGYFTQDHSVTVFSTLGRDGMLRENKVRYCALPDDVWATDNKGSHQEMTRRFWALYLNQCGGHLVSFQTDIPTAFQSLVNPDLQDISQLNSYKSDPNDRQMEIRSTKTELHQQPAHSRASINIDKPEFLWLTLDAAAYRSINPGPSVLPAKGLSKIGLTWSTLDNPKDTDLDLHVRLHGNSEDLNWQNKKSSFGTHAKDFTTDKNANKGFEYAQITNVGSPSDLDIWVNVYDGKSPTGFTGEVRLLFEGKLFSYPFKISGKEGTHGAESPYRTENSAWVHIPTETAK